MIDTLKVGKEHLPSDVHRVSSAFQCQHKSTNPLKMRRMTVETSTQNNTSATKPRGRPSIDFTNMNILINTTTTETCDKPTLVYDLLSHDEPVCNVTLTDEQKKDKYLLVIATTLMQLTSKGDKQKNSHKHFRSSSGRLPPITLEAYIARLLQYAPCDREVFLTALIYMDRLAERVGFIFNSMNIHRSYLTSLMVAAKFFEDQPCDNGYFATVGGVSVQEINAMELTFLDLMEYRVAVTGSEYNVYAQVMEAKADYLEKPRQHYLKEAIAPDTNTLSLGLVMKSLPSALPSTIPSAMPASIPASS